MKKVSLVLASILAILCFSGCGSKDVKLDLNKISKELDNLTSDEISFSGIDYEEIGVFGDLNFVYDYDFEKLFGLDSELISEYSVNYNEKTKEILAIFKPVSASYDEVKKQLESFMNSINATLEEYNGVLIYVASKDNSKVIEKVKSYKTPVFPEMIEVSKNEIKDILDVDSSSVDKFLMKMPMMMIQSSTYIIVKPNTKDYNLVKEKLDSYMLSLEEQWSNYLPDQYELVKNRKVETLGDYLIYIVSENNDLVYNTILNNKIEG